MADKGKNITDPAYGDQEIRGGETPAAWKGPLPAAAPPPETVSDAEQAAPDDPAVRSAVREAQTGDRAQLRPREETR